MQNFKFYHVKFLLQNGREIWQTENKKENAKGEWIIYAADLDPITSDEYNEFALMLKQWEEQQMNPNKMTKILSEKLTKEEFFQLFELMDSDGPAGPFWESVAEKAEELFPDEFNQVVLEAATKEELPG